MFSTKRVEVQVTRGHIWLRHLSKVSKLILQTEERWEAATPIAQEDHGVPPGPKEHTP